MVITTPAGYFVWRMSRERWIALQKTWFRLVLFTTGVIRSCGRETYSGEAIVRRTRECKQIDLAGWLGNDDFSGVADGDFEQSCSLGRHLCSAVVPTLVNYSELETETIPEGMEESVVPWSSLGFTTWVSNGDLGSE